LSSPRQAGRWSPRKRGFICTCFFRYPSDDDIIEAEIAASDEHWQGRNIAMMLRHTKAGDTGAGAQNNADFIGIKT